MYGPKQCADLITRDVDGEALILDRARGKIHELNATASFIWNACDGTKSIEKLTEEFAATFGVTATLASQDVTRIIGCLEGLGLLEAAPQALETMAKEQSASFERGAS